MTISSTLTSWNRSNKPIQERSEGNWEGEGLNPLEKDVLMSQKRLFKGPQTWPGVPGGKL